MKVHTFTESGLGKAPFQIIGFFSVPSPGSEEYQRACESPFGNPFPKKAFSCAHCGMGILNHFVVRSSDGVESFVGSSCVTKTGDKGLIDTVKRELARFRREAREAKRQAEWDAKMSEMMPSGLTRKQEMELEADQREREIRERQESVRSVWAPVIHALKVTNGDFARDWAEALESGNNWPRGRALGICIEITAKKAGRRNSKAFNAEWDRIADLLGEGMAAIDPKFQI